MSSGVPSVTVPVLVAAAGAGWEAEVVDRLERGAPAVVLTRRCVDLTDLLGAAGTGLASVAVVSSRLAGLDADSVENLRASGVAVVLVAETGETADGSAERMRRIGIEEQVGEDELGGLLPLLARAGSVVGRETPDDAAAGDTVTARGDDRRTGRVLTVWGPAGAPGRTTVAVGVATEIARSGREAFLLDLDPYGGAVAQHLGVLDEVSGVLAAARAANAGRLRPELLASTARQVEDRMRVLTGLPRADRWREVRPAALDDLLRTAARLASYVVFDVGFSPKNDQADPFGGVAPQRNEMTLAGVARADEVLVVGAADPVGLARLARGLVELRDTVPAVRARVVVNRTRATLGWSDREIRGMVEGFLTPLDVHFLPDDRAAADRALMAGRSLAESGESPLRAAMVALARAVVGDPVAPVRRRRAGRDR
jgi:MinD-like ATPase involved in chromosome partitioning or flagellar assembly